MRKYSHRKMHQNEYHIKHSQNFIKSAEYSAKIVQLMELKKEDIVFEIGPGKGALTQHAILKAGKVIAIEKDQKLAYELKERFRQYGNLLVVNDDILSYRFQEYGEYKLIGNIPFAITTKIIKKVLDFTNPPKSSYLIIQREAAMRFIGMENELKYESSITLSYKPWFKITKVIDIDRNKLFPVPSVQLTMIRILKRDTPIIQSEDKIRYLDFINYCFLNSKKSTYTSLKKLFTYKQLGRITKENNIDLKVKPSSINFETWVFLFNTYKKLNNKD